MLDKATHHTRALCIDLELRCWSETPPLGMVPEIIEIGVVEVDPVDLCIVKEAAYFVRPRRWEISQKCTRLTGITAGDIKDAKAFPEVMSTVIDNFRPKATLCYAWGGDFALVAKACRLTGVADPFQHRVDLSQLFQGIVVAKQQSSLIGALELMGLQFEGVPHGALSDARNTARLHRAMLSRLRMVVTPPPTPYEWDEPELSSPFAQKLAHALER